MIPDAILEEISRLSPSDPQTWLSVGARLRRYGDPGLSAWLQWSKNPDYKPGSCYSAWKNLPAEDQVFTTPTGLVKVVGHQALPVSGGTGPVLRAIVTRPTRREDGSLIASEGYDPLSQLYYAPVPEPQEPVIDSARLVLAWPREWTTVAKVFARMSPELAEIIGDSTPHEVGCRLKSVRDRLIEGVILRARKQKGPARLWRTEPLEVL